MSLRDHFHLPLSTEYPWHSVHNGWAYNLATSLNQRLPDHCHALPNVQFGIEVDVAPLARSTRAGHLLEAATAPTSFAPIHLSQNVRRPAHPQWRPCLTKP